MADNPPVIKKPKKSTQSTGTTRNANASADGLSYGSDKSGNLTYLNPYGLGEKLGTVPIPGGAELIFGSATKTPRGSFGHPTKPTVARDTPTADQLVQQFEHLSPDKLKDLQTKLYRGGYYSGNFVPRYGLLSAEDTAAFRQFLIGVASNPTAGLVGDQLDQSADIGDTNGINLSKRAPLVVKLTSPDDIRAAADNVSEQLFAGKLSEDEMQRFITTYQSLQSGAQTAGYNAGDPSQTGVLGGLGGTVVQPPDLGVAAKNAVLQDHPNQVFVSALGQQLKALGPSITQPGGGFL